MNHYLGVVLASLLLFGCTSLNSDNKRLESIEGNDPLESFNRKIFNFNYNVLDPYIIRPVAIYWCHYVPSPFRVGLNNFFRNLDEPASMINAFLIGKPRQAMINFTRFFLNSTLGLGGIIDVASKANTALVPEQPQRFGDTLGQYGVGYGPYLELPIYGGFTIREDGGDFVDMFYPVLSWLTWPMSIGKWILESIEVRAQLLDSDVIFRNQQDPYTFIRSAYFQYHDFIANGGELQLNKNSNNSAIQNDIKNIDM